MGTNHTLYSYMFYHKSILNIWVGRGLISPADWYLYLAWCKFHSTFPLIFQTKQTIHLTILALIVSKNFQNFKAPKNKTWTNIFLLIYTNIACANPKNAKNPTTSVTVVSSTKLTTGKNTPAVKSPLLTTLERSNLDNPRSKIQDSQQSQFESNHLHKFSGYFLSFIQWFFDILRIFSSMKYPIDYNSVLYDSVINGMREMFEQWASKGLKCLMIKFWHIAYHIDLSIKNF